MTANVVNPKLGEIWMVDLPKNNGFCLHGPHRCIVIKRFGSTVQIVPISENRNNIHYAEIPIDRGKCNLKKDSKIKMCQYTSATIENFKNIKGKADRATLKKIRDFILEDIVNFIDQAA
jgi:mRNA-degrading endonuclease toxin of MazEF toxin-antitoxin module